MTDKKTTDIHLAELATATAAAFEEVYPDAAAEAGDSLSFDADSLISGFERPKDPTMGRYALAVFRYARLLKEKPQEIAGKIAEATQAQLVPSSPIRVTAAGGFVNAKIDTSVLARATLGQILDQQSNYGGSDIGGGKKFLIEYSSPNVAKPFGIAHLRTTIIGNSLRRMYKKLGYDVVGINYFGDWGTQFGKMIVAFRHWGNPAMLEKNAIENLHELYVRFHDEAEENESLNDEAREAFRLLEAGDPEVTQLWRDFSDRSIIEFKRVYALMGIDFDLWIGESDMNEAMEQVIQRLDDDGLSSISDGALIVDLHDPQLPPCLLKKADGATLYATRDIAGMVHRWEKFRFEESLYVVAVSQSDHFKQVFKVIDMMEEAEKIPSEDRMTGKAKHIDFGWIKFGDKVMSTRRGQVIYLEDVLGKAVELVKKIMAEKNPDLADIDQTALAVGVGAIVFSQFSVRRQKDVNFTWESVLNFDGETGPYLQYTHARLCSLMRKAGIEASPEVDYTLLDNDEEARVVELLADFPMTVRTAASNYEPFFVASYLLRLSAAFNSVYQRKDADGRIDRIVSEDHPKLTRARIALVKAVQITIKEGLNLLGINAPEQM